jgi:hypothetical protein
MSVIPFRRILPIVHCALMLVTYCAMTYGDWEYLRRYDRAWVRARTQPASGPVTSGTGPVAFDDPIGICCWWPYSWRVVFAFEFPAMIATGGTLMDCASPDPFGLRLHRHLRPLLHTALLVGILLVAVCLQWWLVGKWLDRIIQNPRWRTKARFWAAVFLAGPIVMWLGYWTPIADYVLIAALLAMLLLWLFLAVYIPVTWKSARQAAA